MLFSWLHLHAQSTLIHPRFPILKRSIYKIKLYICLKITHDIGVCGYWSYGGGGVVVQEIQVSLCCDGESQQGQVSLVSSFNLCPKLTTHTIMMKGTAKSQGGQWIGGRTQYFTVGNLNRVKQKSNEKKYCICGNGKSLEIPIFL